MGLAALERKRSCPIIWYKVFHRKPSTLMFNTSNTLYGHILYANWESASHMHTEIIFYS